MARKRAAERLQEQRDQAGRNGCHEEAPGEPPGLEVESMGRLHMRPVDWLVPDFFPLGGLAVLAADGGIGKSVLALDIAARLSVGACCLGLDYEPPPPAQTLLIQCEDSEECTVLPRLIAAGADPDMVLSVVTPSFTLSQTPALDRVLSKHPGVRQVIIDPVSAYVPAGMNDHVDAEVRGLLRPLDELADARGLLVVLIKHLNKSESNNAGNLISGSRAYVNASRAAFLVGDDPDDEGRQVLVYAKRNLTARSKGLAFARVPLSCEDALRVLSAPQASRLDEPARQALREQLFRIQWLGETDVTAKDLARSRRGVEPGGRTSDRDREKAADWLRTFLARGPQPSLDCVSAGNTAQGMKHGLDWWRDNVLKGELGGKPVRTGFGANQVWKWQLAENVAENGGSPGTFSQCPQGSQGSQEGVPWDREP